ncbi:MAG: hypothetical protein Q9160_006095 [Pyrenula sp. 1 TL-2023]
MPSATADEGFTLPVAKRQKLSNGNIPSVGKGSRLFVPFRTIGLVSPTAVPFTSVPLGKTTFQITTSVGRNLQTYDLRRGLNLVFLSHQQTPGSITASHAYRDRVFVAWAAQDGTKGIWVSKRGRYVAEFETVPAIGSQIERILAFGSWIIGCTSKSIHVWRADNYEYYTELSPSGGAQRDRTLSGAVSNLPTFLNKVFVGRSDGNVEIWNVATGKLVYTIVPPSAECGSAACIEPTPSLSILAIGYSTGLIALRDVEKDSTVLELKHSQKRPVTSISFRTDGVGAGRDARLDGVMASGSIESGDVTLWDLNDGGKVAGILRGAHDVSSQSKSSGINKVEFLPDQAILVSSGLDNSLRSWIFDQSPFSPIPRPLHSRSGHGAPVTALSFLPAASDGSDAAGKWLLSAGLDRSLWGFSLRGDGQSAELSQGHIRSKLKKIGQTFDQQATVEDLKAPEITGIAACLNRDAGMGTATKGPVWTNVKGQKGEESNIAGWESVVTTHKGDSCARTWFWGKKKAGRWAFETGDGSEATTVAITSCGTFALVGSAGGCLDMFNLQSGIHRQRFPPKLTAARAKKMRLQQLQADEDTGSSVAHTKGVTGIAVESLNRFVISCSLDGSLRFWDFLTGKLLDTLFPTSFAITALCYCPNSDLISIASDDLCIRVLDIETKKFVRELWGCSGSIYDHCFSNDGRWIVACSMDSIVRVWDLPTGHMIDAFRPETTVTNLAFSTTGEYLATAHAGNLGICLWNNKSLYRQVPTRQIDEDAVLELSTPTVSAEQALAIASEDIENEAEAAPEAAHPTIDQLNSQLLTLSLVPQSRWQTLLHLDAIRQRNKPTEPPKQPQKAPFFLPSTLSASTPAIDPPPPSSSSSQPPTQSSTSRISRIAATSTSTSPLTHLLAPFTHSPSPDPTPLATHLTPLPPSTLSLLITTLTPAELSPFVRFLTARLHQRRDYELINTWMSVFLKAHGDSVQGDEPPGLAGEVARWRDAVRGEEERLGGMVGWGRGVVGFLRS